MSTVIHILVSYCCLVSSTCKFIVVSSISMNVKLILLLYNQCYVCICVNACLHVLKHSLCVFVFYVCVCTPEVGIRCFCPFLSTLFSKVESLPGCKAYQLQRI